MSNRKKNYVACEQNVSRINVYLLDFYDHLKELLIEKETWFKAYFMCKFFFISSEYFIFLPFFLFIDQNYLFRISEDESKLSSLLSVVSDVQTRLESRAKLAPADFVSTLEVREKAVHASPYTPVGPVDTMFGGTWYLESIDDKHRRQYSRVPVPAVNGHW